MSREGDATVYEIAYSEAVRALAEQHALIESLRSRAGLILSVGAITTSFLGAQALGYGSPALAWVALGAFTIASSFCLAVLWPRARELESESAMAPPGVPSFREPVPPQVLHRRRVSQLRNGFSLNQRWVGHLALLLQLASSLFAADVVLWLAAIALK